MPGTTTNSSDWPFWIVSACVAWSSVPRYTGRSIQCTRSVASGAPGARATLANRTRACSAVTSIQHVSGLRWVRRGSPSCSTTWT